MAITVPKAAIAAATDLTYAGQQLTAFHAKHVLDRAAPSLVLEYIEAALRKHGWQTGYPIDPHALWYDLVRRVEDLRSQAAEVAPTPPSDSGKGKCTACGGSFVVKKDGTLRWHGDGSFPPGMCEGAGELPVKIESAEGGSQTRESSRGRSQ